MHAIAQRVKALLEKYPSEGNYVVAFSGGCDSMVLLHVLHSFLGNERLRTVHVNHGLLQEAKNWDQFCRQQSESLGIPYQSHNVELVDLNANIEEQARNARYLVFEEQSSS